MIKHKSSDYKISVFEYYLNTIFIKNIKNIKGAVLNLQECKKLNKFF